MKTFIGKFYTNNLNNEIDATILLAPKIISIGFLNTNQLHQLEIWKYKNIESSYNRFENKTTISNVINAQKIIIENDVTPDIEKAVQYNKRNWLLKKIEKDGWKFFGFLAFLIGLCIAFYIFAVPFLSEQLAKTVPKKYEILIGNKLYYKLIDSTKKDIELTNLVNTYFRYLNVETTYPIQITVIKDPTVNAFAILGGHIIIYTGLLQKIKTHQELAALLSHEFTHIQNKHTTRTIFRALGSKVFLALLLGKMGNLTNIVLNNTDQLIGLGYGRNLEKEADLNGLQLLLDRKINNLGFVKLFENLKLNNEKDVAEILSSHPDIEKRINYIKANKNFTTGDSTTATNLKLNAVFKILRGDSDF